MVLHIWNTVEISTDTETKKHSQTIFVKRKSLLKQNTLLFAVLVAQRSEKAKNVLVNRIW